VKKSAAGVVEGRLWWEQSSVAWELPFYSELGLTPPPDRDDALAAREQLWAIRERLSNPKIQPI
jgi:hypothetical protein